MAVLNTLQAGSFNIPKGTMQGSSITITSVDTTKSIFFWNYSVGNSTVGNDNEIFGQLKNPTTLYFERNSAGINGGIQWYVAEFSEGVFVEHNTTTVLSGTTANIALNNTFDLNKSFPIISWSQSGAAIEGNDYIGAQLATNNTLRLIAKTFSAATVAYQVVQWNDGYTQVGTSSYAVTGSYNSIALALGVTNAALITSEHYDTTLLRITGQAFSVSWQNTGNIVISRQSGNGVAVVYWNAFSLGDRSRVQTGTSLLAVSAGSATITLNQVDTARSIAFINGPRMSMGSITSENTLQGMGTSLYRAQLISPTQLLLARNLSSLPSEVGWTVIEFNNIPAEQPWISVD